RRGDALAALREGKEQMHGRAYTEAERSFARGLALAEGIAWNPGLSQELADELQRARRGQAADQLHMLANHIRFLYADDSRTAKVNQSLEDNCQKVWTTRRLIAEHAGHGLDAKVEQQIRADFLDLAILSAALRSRSATGGPADQAYRDAL